jgi:hypothetical protein
VALSTKSRQTSRDERNLIDRWRVGRIEIAREPSNGVPLRPRTTMLGDQSREFERFAEVKHANLSRRCLSHQQVASLECPTKDGPWVPLRGQATPLGAGGRRLRFDGHYSRGWRFGVDRLATHGKTLPLSAEHRTAWHVQASGRLRSRGSRSRRSGTSLGTLRPAECAALLRPVVSTRERRTRPDRRSDRRGRGCIPGAA